MPEQLSREELSDIVDIVLMVGQAMLQSGAATFRTEETMARIGLGMGADRLDLYVTPTGIIATAVSGQEQRTRVGRVGPLGVNMAHADAFNQFSRHVSLVGVSVDAARQQIETINAMPRELPSWVTILAVALACGAFSQILGAGWTEFVAAMVGAGVAQFFRMRLHRAGVNPFALVVLCAWAGSMIAWTLCQFLPSDHIDLAVIASVLLLVPGVPLVTSVLDLTNYDLVSGVTRGTLALLLVLSIGIGVLLTLAITGLRLI
jgi:uncharacterized membrane protein YjjP (DUF1212 family)